MIKLEGHEITEYKIYKKRVMCKCPFHVSSKGGYDLDITLTGDFAGKYFCYGCKKSGTVPKEDIEKLLKLRGEVKEDKQIVDWNQLNQKCIRTRFQMGVFPPLKVSVPVHAQLEWGFYNGSHTFPERNAEDQIIGIMRRFPDRKKGVVSGSKRGIYIPRINFDPDKPLFISEGLSDLSIVLECGCQGIAVPAAGLCLEMAENWINKHVHSDQDIVIIADNDTTGIESAKDLSLLLGYYERVSYDVPQKYSDLYEMYEELGKEEVIKWLSV